MSTKEAIAPTGTTEITSSKALQKNFSRAAAPYLMYGVFVALIVFFSLQSPVFFTASNFLNIGQQTALVTIIAVGMTFVIISGEIDLSVGASLALSGVAAALAMESTGGNLLVGVVVGLSVGALIGLVNGLITTGLGIPSFLVTLATLGIARGLALMISQGQPVLIANSDYWNLFNSARVFGIPVPMLWTVFVLLIGVYLLHVSAYGRRVYAVGGNRKAALYSGIMVNRVKIWAFVLTGAAAGFAGLIWTARAQAARPDTGNGMELDVIAAVILGGTSLFGGKGMILGTLVGSLIIGVINNGLTLMGVSSSAQMIVKGAIIIVAVALSTLRRR